MNEKWTISVKVPNEADRRVLCGILAECGCSVSVDKRDGKSANGRRTCEHHVAITTTVEVLKDAVKNSREGLK